MRISIIGAGISGLSSAYYLQKFAKEEGMSLDISIYEKNSVSGGSLSTIVKDGFIIEEGADSFITSKPWGLELCRELGLESRLISPIEQNRKTYVYADNKLQMLPDGFFLLAPSNAEAFSESDFFTESEKERILAEKSVPVREENSDETIDEFVTRRFGERLLEKVAKPLIGGIYTGDTSKLSASSVLSEFVSMEKKYGSVIKGLEQKLSESELSGSESGARYGLFLTLDTGIHALVQALIESMRDVTIRNDCELTSITSSGKSWKLHDSEGREYICDGLILAVPCYIASTLLADTDAKLSGLLQKIEYASSLVAVMGIKKEELINVPECFGIVVPPSERMNILACSFSSRKFPGRNREGYELIRCFAGGINNAEIVQMPDSKIGELLINELNMILKTDVKPDFLTIKKYINAMPQYNLGHSGLIDKIFKRITQLNTITVAGNGYEGVGIPDCINSGRKASRYLIDRLIQI